MIKVFTPSGATVNIAATAASASVAIDGNSNVVRVYNKGPNVAFVSFSLGASTATLTDMPIAVGATEKFTKGMGNTASAICAATETATIYLTCGDGI